MRGGKSDIPVRMTAKEKLYVGKSSIPHFIFSV